MVDEVKYKGGDVASAPLGGSTLGGSEYKGGRRSRKGLVHFKKGSKEAKEFMAKLRAMRGKTRKGKKKGGNPHAIDGNGDGQAPPAQDADQMNNGSNDEPKPELPACTGAEGEKPNVTCKPIVSGGRRRKSYSKKHKKVKGGRKSRKHCKGKKGWKMW